MSGNEKLELLERAAAEHGQAAVARELGCSEATVCLILKGRYSNPARWLERCEEVYGGVLVECPVFGCEIPLGRCAEERRRLPRRTNPVARRLTETCPSCPRRRK